MTLDLDARRLWCRHHWALSIRRSRTALTELIKLVPPCQASLRSNLRDPTIPRRHKITPAIAIAYLAFLIA